MKIFLADRDEAFLESLEQMLLRDCGDNGQLEIERSTDFQLTIAKLTSNSFDVCFLNDSFDNGSGVDIMRSLDKLPLRTAIIFLTELADKAAAYTALRYGAMDYLIKSKLDSFGLVKSLAFSLFRKSREMELRGAALHDSLTGLGNRVLFREQAGKQLQQAKRARDQVGVLFMDIDGLKPVNDTYGHQVGDKLLQMIATRLQERTRESDIIARVGGDEFVALLSQVDSPLAVSRVAGDLTDAISKKPFQVDHHDIRVGLSCGSAIYPDDSDNIDDLIRLADLRMYDVKARNKKIASGGQISWYSSSAHKPI